MGENTKAWRVAVGYNSVSVGVLRESAYGRYWCISNLD